MGTLLNSFRYAAGTGYTYTKSLDLDGADEYVSVPHNATLSFDTVPFTVTAYVKFDVAGSVMVIAAKRSTATNNPGWEFRRDALNRLRFIIADTGSGTLNVYTTETLSAGVWYSVTVSTDGGTFSGTQIYINGTAATMNLSSSTLSASRANTGSLDLGRRWDGNYLNGKLFRVGLYNVALTAGQVSTIYALSPKNLEADAGTVGNLVAYWRCGNNPLDNATGGTGVIHDDVGGYNGTPINTEAGDIVTDAP